MKNLITLFSLLMVFSTTFTSCDKDDDSDQTGLVGTWEISKIIIDKMDNKDLNLEVTSEMLNPKSIQRITFNSDGTIKFGFFNANWELLENNTKLKITFPSLGDFELDSEILDISIQKDLLIITSDDVEYTNADKDPDGEFSFTKLDETFNTNIKDKSYIEVSSKEYFTRQ